LHRLFALHVAAIPLLLVGLVVAHVMALHEVGSNNPDGIEIKARKNKKGIPLDGVPFHPYYTVKDLFGVGVFLIIFFAIIFFVPTMGGYFLEHDNFIPANALMTPPHIKPSWYFTPYYAILRAVTINFFGIPAKTWGVIALVVAVLLPAFLPWLDRSPVKSVRYKGWISKTALILFAISFIALAWLGLQPPLALYRHISQVFMVIYFAFFILMPFYSRLDKTKPVPERLTTKHLGESPPAQEDDTAIAGQRGEAESVPEGVTDQ
jgi:ubiquinol-cytochrome c reductase cytochrome b subunit